jgi:hypothetical protein
LANYFYDVEKKEYKNGFPVPKEMKKARTSAQWKLYFGEVNQFLIDTLTEHFKIEVKDFDKQIDDDFAKDTGDFK